ncbi:GNAT family protein [uncultured Legionella sp.]|uniref:GNAT family N-acetyltransferase n=1 Tax=uncultured Legionella sp. TaxID=210934 RepID=UPI00262A6C9D|nr:GNAT family protein [uncultured Legionella sp.]
MLNINEFEQITGTEVISWLARKRPEKKPINGSFCILEPMDINKHAKDLYESLLMDNKGESWTYLPYGPFQSLHEFKAWLERTCSEEDVVLYTILDIKNQLPIGVSGYLRINNEHGVVEVEHLHFSKLLQKTAAATEAMYLMMFYAFDILKYRRYEWKCNSLNKASWNAAIRLGFKFEGIFRQSNVYKNCNRDTAWFSIIDAEWPELNQRFIRWLNPDNFDLQGRQKLSLNEI